MKHAYEDDGVTPINWRHVHAQIDNIVERMPITERSLLGMLEKQVRADNPGLTGEEVWRRVASRLVAGMKPYVRLSTERCLESTSAKLRKRLRKTLVRANRKNRQ